MYVHTKAKGKTPETVVFIVHYEGENAVVLTEQGEFRVVPLADLYVPDANAVTPFASWPGVE